MIRLDADWLRSIGLGALSSDTANEMLAFARGELELRVGRRLAARLTKEQLDEFEALIDSGDEAASLAFIEQTSPDRTSIVVEEFDRLSTELSRIAPSILEAEGLPTGEEAF